MGKRKEKFKCQTLKVDQWKEIEISSEEIEDICDNECEMEESAQEKWWFIVVLFAWNFYGYY